MNGDLYKDELEQNFLDINEKLDTIIAMLKDTNGIKGFGLNVLANIVGNMVDRNK